MFVLSIVEELLRLSSETAITLQGAFYALKRKWPPQCKLPEAVWGRNQNMAVSPVLFPREAWERSSTCHRNRLIPAQPGSNPANSTRRASQIIQAKIVLAKKCLHTRISANFAADYYR